MFRCLNLLLLFSSVSYSGTAPVGNTHISVTGKRGGSVILPCEFESRGISDIVLSNEISVETGEQLKMDVLLINADKVEKNSRGEWTEVWTRGHGVSSDRLTDRDGNLTIKEFTVSDTGTYRVLDSEGEIWITVTVTESSTDFNRKLDTDDIKPYDTEQFTVGHWILSVGMVVYAVLLTLVLIILVIRKHQFRNKKVDHDSSQGIPLQSVVHEAQIT
ncbi:uncharacterized protein [Chanodichthys erythropterus]|uniref:uncharacterized protein isoform X2 n=1 Tax=Chanodichthys erythropterus TaxID=933992 RepID=UPI00351E8D81